MKYRWLKITGNMIWGTNSLIASDLVMRRDGRYDTIIDTQEGTYYDPETNDWLKVPGEPT